MDLEKIGRIRAQLRELENPEAAPLPPGTYITVLQLGS
jgi:hypothetical protein